jgi:hypothetical protein
MKTIQRTGKIHSEPGPLAQHPWTYRLGQDVYVAGHSQFSYKVTGGELWLGFPHYHLLDADGHTWRITQLRVSSKPIPV